MLFQFTVVYFKSGYLSIFFKYIHLILTIRQLSPNTEMAEETKCKYCSQNCIFL